MSAIHPPTRRLTDEEVGTYLVYRFKMNELIHLHFLWISVNDDQCGDSFSGVATEQILGTLRTAAIAWLATVVDKSGLDIFRLWHKMFPQYEKRINLFRTLLQPHLDIIRRFRNKTAFHAEPEFAEFFEPRVQFQENAKDIVAGVQRFLALSSFLVKRELTADPELYSRMLNVVFDAELKLGCTISRRWLVQAHIVDESAFKTQHF
jgi:hypothetical protein